MSDIKVGSEWNLKSEGSEVYTVKNIALNPDDGLVYVFLDKMFEGWDIFSKNDFLRKFKPKLDMVNEPPHYTSGQVECIDAIRSALTDEEFRGFCKGNVLKYTWRERHKGGDESLKKAIWYLEQLSGVADD